MTDQETLIRQIVRNPSDPFPRLIYADWLEEYGDLYGIVDCHEAVAMIRDEKPLANRKKKVCRWRHKAIRGSVHGFPKTYQLIFGDRFTDINNPDDLHMIALASGRWVPSLRDVVAFVRHGFIEQLWCNQGMFLKVAKSLFERHPIRDVFLTRQYPQEPSNNLRDLLGYVTLSGMIDAVTQASGVADMLPDSLITQRPLIERRHSFRWVVMGNTVGSWPEHGVARPIFERMPVCLFPSVRDAHIALSAACVRWGRSLAGLPALEVAA